MTAIERQFKTGFGFRGRVTDPGIVIDTDGRIWHVQIDGSRVELGQGIPPQVAARGLVSESMDPMLAMLATVGAPVLGNNVGASTKVMLTTLGIPRGQTFSKMGCFPVSPPSGGSETWADVTVAKMAIWKPDGTFVASTGNFHASLADSTPLEEDFVGGEITADVTSYLGGLLLLCPAATFPAQVVGSQILATGGWPAVGSVLSPCLITTESVSDLDADITPKAYETGDLHSGVGFPYLNLA